MKETDEMSIKMMWKISLTKANTCSMFHRNRNPSGNISQSNKNIKPKIWICN